MIDHNICDKVASAFSSDLPFSHFYGDDFFSDEAYGAMLDNLPGDELYEDLKHADAYDGANSTRRRLVLTEDSLKGISPIWKYLHQTLTSDGYRNAVFSKLKTDILNRFGTLKVKCSPTVTLYRDVSGYKIRPHQDHRTKVVTTQYYLPPDSSIEDLGTELYFKNGDDFDIYHKMKFLPKHGYGFAVSDKSWHGVSQITRPGIIRNSILVIYYLNAKTK